jgi:hypothetical protein
MAIPDQFFKPNNSSQVLDSFGIGVREFSFRVPTPRFPRTDVIITCTHRENSVLQILAGCDSPVVAAAWSDIVASGEEKIVGEISENIIVINPGEKNPREKR